MNKHWIHSLITKITLIFTLAILGIMAIAFSFHNYNNQKELENIEQLARYSLRGNYVNHGDFDITNFKDIDFTPVQDQKLAREIFEKNKPIFPPSLNQNRGAGMAGTMMHQKIKAVIYRGKFYIIIKQNNDKNLLFNTPFSKDIFSSILFPLLFIVLVLLLYIAIIKAIIPIYDLQKKVRHFALGDYEINCASTNKDEIGLLANEFHNAVQKIKQLRDSRQLFLRNIMHELKTPITKGKFLAESITNSNHQKALQNIFNRQEALLRDFSRIEKLSADEIKLDIRTYNLEDILDFALDILDADSLHVKSNITPIRINADFELFGTALKNLLDNGIKYASDHKVTITNSQEQITITNEAPTLEFPLERYAEPYFLEGKKQKSSRGLGFGLFITYHIIKLHGMQLLYERNDANNIFTIKL
ncbi:MAG: HAMP domain-containing histidine kinase [Sulfurospirillum sp.]|nr:HAMP domain-containing histidine kinase [Sulfurospirillum sp.]